MYTLQLTAGQLGAKKLKLISFLTAALFSDTRKTD